jgi:hypothetical protein
MVAAGTHHRLRALVHAHCLRFSARDLRAEAAHAQLRGRLQEPARARRHRAVGAGWEVDEDRVVERMPFVAIVTWQVRPRILRIVQTTMASES